MCLLIDKLMAKRVCLAKHWFSYGSIETKLNLSTINIIRLSCLIIASDIDIHGLITSRPEDSNKLDNISQVYSKWQSKQRDYYDTFRSKYAQHYTSVHDRK